MYSFRKSIFFEIKRYDGNESHRGTFEVQKVGTLSKERIVFFAVACCHEEDAYPYSSCFGIIKTSSAASLSNSDIKRFFSEEKNLDLVFDSILFFGVGKNEIAFGPACLPAFEQKIKKILPKERIIPWETIKKISKGLREKNEEECTYTKKQAKFTAEIVR
jgi:hypothetical protein